MEDKIKLYIQKIAREEELPIPTVVFKYWDLDRALGELILRKDGKPPLLLLNQHMIDKLDDFKAQNDYFSIWDTILHEIAHIRFYNHNDKFWEYFEELKNFYPEMDFWNFCFPKIETSVYKVS
ncbi:MAG: Wss1p-related putative metallopeptidase [Nanoarchaeota archaeon]